MKSAWFHFERVGGVSILHVSGYIDRDVEERFERALREAALGPPDSVLTVSLLKCSYINYTCLLALSRLPGLAQTPVHIVAAPGTDARRQIQLAGLSSALPVHDGFRDAFCSIGARSSSRKRPLASAGFTNAKRRIEANA